MFGGMNIYVSAALGFDFGPETLNNRWGAPNWQPVLWKLAHVWGGSSIPFATCSLDTLQSTSIHWVFMTRLTCSLAASTLGSGMIPWPSRRLVAFYLAAPINRRWPLNDNTGLGRWHSMNSQKIFRTTVYTRKTSKLCSEILSRWWNTRTTCCDWFRAGSDFLQHQAEGLQQRASYVLGSWMLVLKNCLYSSRIYPCFRDRHAPSTYEQNHGQTPWQMLNLWPLTAFPELNPRGWQRSCEHYGHFNS